MSYVLSWMWGLMFIAFGIVFWSGVWGDDFQIQPDTEAIMGAVFLVGGCILVRLGVPNDK